MNESHPFRAPEMKDHEDILIALRRITRAIDLQSRWLQKESGLTAPQLVVLNVLQREGQLSASTLARGVSLSQATVTRILDRLEAAGFIERRKSAKDRRLVVACLTEKGQNAVQSAPDLLQSDFLSKFDHLQSWERKMLVASLQRIAELMDAEGVEAIKPPTLDEIS